MRNSQAQAKATVRRERVAKLFRLGYHTYRSIAQQMGYGKPGKPSIEAGVVQVCRDMKHVRKIWKESTVAEYDAYVQEQVQGYKDLMVELYKQWRRSCGNVRKVKKKYQQIIVRPSKPEKRNRDGSVTPAQSEETATVQTGREVNNEERYGDPAIAAQIIKCRMEISKLTQLGGYGDKTLTLKGDKDHPIPHTHQIDLTEFEKMDPTQQAAFIRQAVIGGVTTNPN